MEDYYQNYVKKKDYVKKFYESIIKQHILFLNG